MTETQRTSALGRTRPPCAMQFHRRRRIAAVVMAVSPPLAGAWFAQYSGRWDLFERTGSITAAVGLVLASRRFIQHGVVELAALLADETSRTRDEEHLQNDIHANKLGLALSAFGMVISGWGRYLGWWSFAYIGVWALFAARDARRDSRHLRGRPAASTADGGDAR